MWSRSASRYESKKEDNDDDDDNDAVMVSSSPFLARMVQTSDLVVKELLHGEPVEGLVGVPADVGVVDVRADHHADPVPAAPAKTDSCCWLITVYRVRQLLR